MSATAASQNELTALCYLMTLDAGLFCVSLSEPPQPGYANPHYPGVRLSLPPGPQDEHRDITISTFRPDGWLDMDRPAALVHIRRGPARVLLTIYHEALLPPEAAPRLAVTRLAQAIPSGGTPMGQPTASVPFVPMSSSPSRVVPGYTAAELPPPSVRPMSAEPPIVPLQPQVAAQPPIGPETADRKPPVPGREVPLTEAQIVAHIRNRGDVRVRLTQWIGLPGSRLWIEGFGVILPEGWAPDDVEYTGVLANAEAMPWVAAPQFCGSRGQTQPMLGFALRLKGTVARLYDCTYRASFIDGTMAGPVNQGQICQSPSLAALEALQVTMIRR
jgi:hypothetical protein